MQALGALYDAFYDGGTVLVQARVASDLTRAGLVVPDGAGVALTPRGRAVVNACPGGELMAVQDRDVLRILRPLRAALGGCWS